MTMYNLTEYSDPYSKASGGLWQYHRAEPALENNGNITDFQFIISKKYFIVAGTATNQIPKCKKKMMQNLTFLS